jgi:hypothetical protein
MPMSFLYNPFSRFSVVLKSAMSSRYRLRPVHIAIASFLLSAFATSHAHAQTPTPAPAKAPIATTKPGKQAEAKIIELGAPLKVGDQARYEATSDNTSVLSRALLDVMVKAISSSETVLRVTIQKLEVSHIRGNDDADKRVASAAASAFAAFGFDIRIATASDGATIVLQPDDLTKQFVAFEGRLLDVLREQNSSDAERARLIAHAKKLWMPALSELPDHVVRSFSADASGVSLPVTKLAMPLVRNNEYEARFRPTAASESFVRAKGSKRLLGTLTPGRYEAKSNVFVHGDAFKTLMSGKLGLMAGEGARKVSGGRVEMSYSIAIDSGNPWPYEIETKTLTLRSIQVGDQKPENSSERLIFVLQRLPK